MNRAPMKKIRNVALAGASAVAMMAVLGGSASAQTVNYGVNMLGLLLLHTNPASSVSDYLITIDSNHLETGAITAVIDGDPIIGGSYPGTGIVVPVTGNSYSSTATGQDVISSVALGLLGTDGLNEGIGILDGQMTANTTVIATITGGTTVLELTDFATGTATLSNNSALASATGNRSNAVVTGDLPPDFVSFESGSANSNLGSGLLGITTGGTVNITNAQVNFNAGYLAGSQATISGYLVEFDHDATGPLTVTGAMTVSNNSIETDYAGNATRNVFLAANGGGLQFQGSVVVSNSQLNTEPGGGAGPVPLPASSLVIGSSIIANIGDAGGDLTELGSVFNMTGNQINARAVGNTAVGVGANGAPLVGNAIAFEPGIDIIGGDTSQNNALVIPSAGTVSTDLDADLLLISGQVNQSTFLSAGVFGGNITAYAETILGGGGVNLSGNQVTAAVTGNNALNLIEAGQTTVIAAVVAAGNLQFNEATAMTAQNQGTGITVTAGALDEDLSGIVTVSNNAVTAAATGNRSGVSSLPTISLDAVNLSSSGGLAVVEADFAGPGSPEYGSLLTDGGITASNLQMNHGAGASITSNVQSAAIAAILLGGAPSVTDGVVTLNENVLNSSASGNVAFTGIELSGAVGSFSSAVSSAQFNMAPIGATLLDTQVTLLADDLVGTVASLTGNRFGAAAGANSANNSLDVSGFTDLTLGGTGVGPSVTMPVLLSHDSSATGALVVLNNQSNVGSVTASASNDGLGFVSVSVNDVTGGSSVSIGSNAVASSAIVNQATNSLSIETANLSTSSGEAEQIATLSNRQTSPGGGATATTEVVGGLGAIGLVATGDVIDAIVSVTGNDLSAFAAGNIGANRVSYIGDVYASDVPQTPMGGSNILTSGNQFDVHAEFVLHSNQSSGPLGFPPSQGGAYTATVSGGAMGVALTGTGLGDLVDGVVITVVDNDTLADARANFVNNNLSLTGFSALSTSTALQSTQGNGSAVSASVVDAIVGIEADDYNVTGAVLTVSGNDATARALGNTAFNTSVIQAEVLGGNAGLAFSGGAIKDTLTGAQSAVTGDYTVTSFQSNFNSVTASASGMYLIDFNDFAAGGNLDGGVATISQNSILAVAQSNTASNGLALEATTAIGLSAALFSEQRSGDGFSSSVTATAGGAGFATAGLAATSIDSFPVSVLGNKVTAIAGDNDAVNTLSATATAALLGTGTASGGANAVIDPLNDNQSIADFALFNTQSSLGTTVTATATPGAIAALSVGDVSNSPIVVNNNAVTAQATINNAVNTLSLNGSTLLAASGSLLNNQTNGPGVGSTSATAVVQGGLTGAIAGGSLDGSPLNVSGNSFIASASGNVATNALNATTTAAYASTPVAASGQSVGGVVSATATYAVLNNQSNVAPISATTQFVAIGTLVGGTVNGGSHLTVSGNSAAASAVGNRANNSITLSSVAGSMPSASLTSAQVNTASVSSNVSGVVIGGLVGVMSGSNAAVTNNSISASAVGNSAVNRIGIGN